MNAKRLFIWITLILALACTSAFCGEVSVIELKYRPANEIVRIVRPQLGPHDTISGKGLVVILTAAPENLARIEAIIRTLDKPSRQLLLTVVQGEEARKALDSIDISGNASIGENAKIEFGRNPQPKNTVAVEGRSSQSRQINADIQRLRMHEGRSALLFIGHFIPVSARTVDPRLQDSEVVYQEVKTGFRVTARLSGNRYVLDMVSQKESTASAGRGAVATQQLQTQVTGQLGKWMDIGAVVGISQHNQSGIVYSDRQRNRSQRPVYINMVEVAQSAR